MTLNEVGDRFRRIDRAWKAESDGNRRIQVVELYQLEKQLDVLDGEVDHGEVREMTRAIRLLRGRIEASLAT